MKNFIEVYDNALSDELCDKIATYMDFVCVDNLGEVWEGDKMVIDACLLYTSPSPRDS